MPRHLYNFKFNPEGLSSIFLKLLVMSDDLHINVPKLAADGSNWVIYRDRMSWAMNLRSLSDHLTNVTMPATYATAGTVNGITAPA